MNIVSDDNGRLVIEGEFYLVQRTDLKKNDFLKPAQPRLDTHGNPRLEWPGASVYPTLEKAESVRQALADGNPEFTFVVMRSVS